MNAAPYAVAGQIEHFSDILYSHGYVMEDVNFLQIVYLVYGWSGWTFIQWLLKRLDVFWNPRMACTKTL